MYGLSGKHILMKNQSRLHLVDVESNTVVNSTSCVGSPRISYDVRFVSCDSVAYKIGESDFVHAHGGHHQSADVETNLSISWWNNGASTDSNQFNGLGYIYVKNGTTTVATIETSGNGKLLRAYHHEGSTKLTLFKGCISSCQGYAAIIDYSTTTSFDLGGANNAWRSMNPGWTTPIDAFHPVTYGVVEVDYRQGQDPSPLSAFFSIAGHSPLSPEGDDYNLAYRSSQCTVKGWDAGTVTGHYITLDSTDIQV
ncbi:MAG: hypothetical protein CL992_04105, partial [Euryarchaeota archaeon]|nr:hypothetical protein [Euryarchaeota archaeon]